MLKTTIATEVVEDAGQFTALRSVWAALLSDSRQNTVFLRWEWLHTWWKVFSSPSMQLQIVLVRYAGQLVGIAPFYLQRGGRISGNTLRFIGTGEAEEDQVVSEYLDLFALEQHEELVIETVAGWIESQTNWRQLRFDDGLGNALCQRVAQRLKGKMPVHSRISGYRYFIELPATFDEYLQRLSQSRRRRYQRCCSALKKAGADCTDPQFVAGPEITQQMRILKQLNSERWHKRAGRGVFESEDFYRFHTEVSRLLAVTGQSEIKVMMVEGRALAALYLFYSESDCHYYQSGFSSVDANRYMPLFISHLATIRECIDRKLKRYDFMRGAASSYKQDFACDDEPMYTTRVWRYKSEGALVEGLHSLRAAPKQLVFAVNKHSSKATRQDSYSKKREIG